MLSSSMSVNSYVIQLPQANSLSSERFGEGRDIEKEGETSGIIYRRQFPLALGTGRDRHLIWQTPALNIQGLSFSPDVGSLVIQILGHARCLLKLLGLRQLCGRLRLSFCLAALA